MEASNITAQEIKNKNLSVFVKYSCGCIGLPPTLWGEIEQSLIIEACDTSGYLDDGDCFLLRDMNDKTFEYLPMEETLLRLNRIASLIHDGQALRELKRIINQN